MRLGARRVVAVPYMLFTGVLVKRVATLLTELSSVYPDVTLLATEPLGGRPEVLDVLAQRTPLGRHLSEPWRVVLAGAPNVGKSSLVNALACYQRSVVAATPGTTRDVVTTQIALDGWPVELADTAGLRDAAEPLEEEGVCLAKRTLAAADLCLWVLDASAEPVLPPEALGPVRLVVNKTDLPVAWDLARAPGAIRVSALTRAGLDELLAALSRWLVPDPPPAGTAAPPMR